MPNLVLTRHTVHKWRTTTEWLWCKMWRGDIRQAAHHNRDRRWGWQRSASPFSQTAVVQPACHVREPARWTSVSCLREWDSLSFTIIMSPWYSQCLVGPQIITLLWQYTLHHELPQSTTSRTPGSAAFHQSCRNVNFLGFDVEIHFTRCNILYCVQMSFSFNMLNV